jgi:hypothetical protein
MDIEDDTIVEAQAAQQAQAVAAQPEQALAQPTIDNISDSATLAFFTNPMYLNILKRKNLGAERDNTVDVKFYRKRIAALFKDLLKGELAPPTEELKEIHNVFLNTAIRYFKRVDTKDIIQGYNHGTQDAEKTPDDLLDEIGKNANEIVENEVESLAEANDIMMRKTVNVSSLDNYVIVARDNSGNPLNGNNALRIIPLKMEIDLKSPDLKTKGVKPKVKKTKV